jgi:hypothetical protein
MSTSTRVTRRIAPTVRISAFAIACATALTIAHSDSFTRIAAATLRAKTRQEAAFVECTAITDHDTINPCRYNDIDDPTKLVNAHMLYTTKYDTDGTELGIKARWIGDGKHHTYDYEGKQTSSPTPRFEHIVALALKCHGDGYVFRTADVKNAYLRASLPPKTHYVRIDPKTADTFCHIRPEWTDYRTSKGHMYAEVNKALYGFSEAGRLWFEHVSSILRSIGCITNARDRCMFKYTDRTTGDVAYITLYVDDFLFAGSNNRVLDHIIQQLQEQFGDIKVESGNQLSYLNIRFNFNPNGELVLDMTQYKKNLVEGLVLPTNVMLPGTTKLMERTDDSPLLNDEEQTFFHQYVAKVLYLATHMHGELSFYVNILAQRTAQPTSQDLQHLLTLLGYIKTIVYDTLTLDASHYSHPVVYIDASYAVNRDYKSQAGACMFFGTGSLFCRSNKETINVKSSTEAELVALSDHMSGVLGIIHFLEEFGIVFDNLTVFQDNKSTIKLIENGYPDGKHSKHIHIRYFWLTDLINNRRIRIVYCPTEDMVADILTKPTSGKIFRTNRDRISGKTRAIQASSEYKQALLRSTHHEGL